MQHHSLIIILCSMCKLYVLSLGVATLGTRSGVTLSADVLRGAENSSSTAEKLAVNLLLSLFSEQELATGNCTKPRKDGILLLDQVKISAIRGKEQNLILLDPERIHTLVFYCRSHQPQVPCVGCDGEGEVGKNPEK